MTKKKRKESWKEKRRRAAIKHQRALEAERVRIEREIERKHASARIKTYVELFAASFLVVLVLAVYATWQPSQPSVSAPPQSSSTNKNEAPAFTLTDINGTSFSLDDFKGKVVILNFFDTKCTWCIPQISELAKIHEKYTASKIIIISIDVYPNVDTVSVLKQFGDEYQINWTIAIDTTLSVSDDYNIKYTPTTVIIDQEGFVSVHSPFIGLNDASAISEELEPLLTTD